MNRLAIWLGAACLFAAGHALADGRLTVGILAFVMGYINLALAEHEPYEVRG
jgi:hypothetical protein